MRGHMLDRAGDKGPRKMYSYVYLAYPVTYMYISPLILYEYDAAGYV